MYGARPVGAIAVIVATLPSKKKKTKRVNIKIESSDRGGTFYVRNINLSYDTYIAIKKAILREALKKAHAINGKKITEEIKKC